MITINFSFVLEQRKGLSTQGPRKYLSEICAQQFLRPHSQSQATEHGAWNDSKPERCDTAQVQLFVVSETMALLVISEKANPATHLRDCVSTSHHWEQPAQPTRVCVSLRSLRLHPRPMPAHSASTTVTCSVSVPSGFAKYTHILRMIF